MPSTIQQTYVRLFLVLVSLGAVVSIYDATEHLNFSGAISTGRARIIYPEEDDEKITFHHSVNEDGNLLDILRRNKHDYLSRSRIDNKAFAMSDEQVESTFSATSNLQLAFHHKSLSVPSDIIANDMKHLTSRYLKTGTTIVGLKVKDCIILAADTRATEGTVVADTRCEKVHQLSQNIWCCGAGTSADLDALTRKVRYTFLLRCMKQNAIGNEYLSSSSFSEGSWKSREENDIQMALGEASISSVCTMIREELYKARGNIGANLVLGGVDQYSKIPILAAIHPHGSIDIVPYTALGSGGLAAMGILEAGYAQELSLEQGLTLVKEAVLAGIRNDLGSGSQVDICVIEKNRVTYTRGVVSEETITMSDGEVLIGEDAHKKHIKPDSLAQIGGVNGFGALPYEIKSRKMLVKSEFSKVLHQRKWMEHVINS
jgi:20S proteasome subunit beta 2